MLQLFTYFRSSAAYRVRIALNLKGLEWQPEVVWLPTGEQAAEPYLATNPQALVPALVDGDITLSQSLAIIEYLDETRPEPRLLPADPLNRARARSLALLIACDIHPLNNLRILKYLKKQLGQDQAAIDTWYRHWCDEGLGGLEREIAGQPTTDFVMGASPGIVDICLVPQVFNALRFDVDMTQYPNVDRIYQNCVALKAFADAAPMAQPEASDPRLK